MRIGTARSRKSATNLSVRTDLVQKARELQINLSDLLERALAREIREQTAQRWLEENREAISSYNAHTAERGLFGDDWRRF